MKTALNAYLPDYEKAGDVYAQLSEHTTDAIQNAKRVEQYHIQNDCNKPFGIAVNPFTDIYQLFYPQIGVGKRLDGGRQRVKKYLWSF